MLGVRLRPSVQASCSLSLQRCCYAAMPQDHYTTLGVERNATAKAIKAAFYELSKRFHPDRHEGEQQKRDAAEKFQQVASAYEILGSDERRRVYDATLVRQQPTATGGYASWPGTPYARPRPTKSYTDIDIDYKNFEQFQRSARSRRNRARHDYFDMPDEFFAEFGGRGFSSQYQTRFKESDQHANYQDSRGAEREREERRRMQEVEEMRKNAAHPPPTFEQLFRQQLARENVENKVSTAAAVLAAIALVFAFFLKRL